MKRSGFLFAVFMLMAAVAFSGCGGSSGGGGGDGDDNTTNPGKIGVALTEAQEFNGKLIICAVFDNNATDETGLPTGDPLGMGYIYEVTDGSGSCVILDEDESEKIFDPGVYYLMALADLNGTFTFPDGEPDTGDKMTYLMPITVNGNVTKSITDGDFIKTVGDGPTGIITVELSEAANFNGKSVLCYIFDNDATVPEGIFNDSPLTSISPRDNPIGIGVIDEVIDGSGSCVIMEAGDETAVKAFTPGVYYLMALADLNDNFTELGVPDAGDKIMSFAWIEADGAVTRDISGLSFNSVLGENCITNGGFEEVRDWTFLGEGDYDYEPGNAYTGVRSVCLAPGSYIEQTYEGPVTEIYSALVAYVYARGNVGDSIEIDKYYYDSAGEPCGGGGGPDNIYTTDYQKCLSIDEWIDGSEKKIKLRITADAENQDDVWIDHVYMGGRL